MLATETLSIINNINSNILFSEEAIAGTRFNGQDVIATRIKNLFGDCKILVGIREQFKLLRSIYAQTALGFHGKRLAFSFHEFIDSAIEEHSMSGNSRGKTALKKIGPLYTLQRLQFDRYTKIYGDVFGAENIHIYPFEELFVDKNFERLNDVTGIKSANLDFSKKEKSSLSYLQYRQNMALGTPGLEYFYRYYWSAIKKISPQWGPKLQDTLTFRPDQIAYLKDVFSKSNNNLASYSNIDLKKYDYV